MKKLKYIVDLKKTKATKEQIVDIEKEGQKTLFEGILNQGLNSRYQSGIGGKVMREFSRILNKLDSAEGGTLELEESEFEIVQDVLTGEQARFNPSQTRLISLYQVELEEAKKNG